MGFSVLQTNPLSDYHNGFCKYNWAKSLETGSLGTMTIRFLFRGTRSQVVCSCLQTSVSGCDTFGPKRIWSLDIWFATIGPQLIGPSGQTVPNQFSPHGQMVPKNSVPMEKWSSTNLFSLDKWFLEYFICPEGQAVGIRKYGDQIDWRQFVQGNQILGDHLFMGTKFDGDRLSRGIEFMEIVCPGGKEVGDQKSRDQMGTIWDQMLHNQSPGTVSQGTLPYLHITIM